MTVSAKPIILSEKLTTWKKERIVKDVMKYKFSKVDLELTQLEDKFSMEVYNATYTKEERQLLSSLPENFVKLVDSISANIAGCWSCTAFYNSLGERRKVRVPAIFKTMTFDGSSAIGLAGSQFTDKARDIRDEKGRVSANIRAILNSVTTTKKLVEIWPEVLPFLNTTTHSSVPNRALPVIRVSELNKMLGLPVDEEV